MWKRTLTKIQNTNQFGMKYTAEQFTKTELLKILNDAAAPHLYQDIFSWASGRQNATNIHSVPPRAIFPSKVLGEMVALEPCRHPVKWSLFPRTSTPFAQQSKAT
jgi:hypothetical protein